MKFDKEHWKDIDINIDSLWLMGPRAKGGKRDGSSPRLASRRRYPRPQQRGRAAGHDRQSA